MVRATLNGGTAAFQNKACLVKLCLSLHMLAYEFLLPLHFYLRVLSRICMFRVASL